MSNICILVSPGKFGLIKECKVLLDRLVKNGCHGEINYSKKIGLKKILSFDVIVIYNLSVKNLLVSLFIFWFSIFKKNRKIIWVNHEPNGFYHKLKNNNLSYALATRFTELFMALCAYRIGTPNFHSAKKFGYFYLPLQYKFSLELKNRINQKKIIGYMGRKDSTRRFSFNDEVIFFPGTYGKKEADKLRFSNDVDAIANIYMRSHAQSGVTPDALSLGLPVFVSSFDSWSDKDWGGYLQVLDYEKTLSMSDDQLMSFIKKRLSNIKFDSVKMRNTFDTVFGEESIKHWLKALKN